MGKRRSAAECAREKRHRAAHGTGRWAKPSRRRRSAVNGVLLVSGTVWRMDVSCLNHCFHPYPKRNKRNNFQFPRTCGKNKCSSTELAGVRNQARLHPDAEAASCARPSSLLAAEQTQSLAAQRGHCRGCAKARRALTAGPQRLPQPDSHGDTWGEAKRIGKSSTISPVSVNGPASELGGEDVLGK